MIGETNERAGNPKAAVEAYRESLAIVQRFVARKGADPQWRGDLNDLTDKIGGIAFPLLLAGDFEDALLAVYQTISLAPDKIWLYTLMFLTRTDEARALYLKYRGQRFCSITKGGTCQSADGRDREAVHVGRPRRLDEDAYSRLWPSLDRHLGATQRGLAAITVLQNRQRARATTRP
jgi:hypothetical protein